MLYYGNVLLNGPPTGSFAPTGDAVPIVVPAGTAVAFHGLSFMGPKQSANFAPFTFSLRLTHGKLHMLLMPPPGAAVLVKVRITAVVTAQVGACG
jgi:hypothetical protein